MAECWTGWIPILLQEVPPNLNNYDFISVFRLLSFSFQKAGEFTLTIYLAEVFLMPTERIASSK